MSRSSTLILIGLLIIITPYSGLPVSFRSLLSVLFGAIVFGFGLSMRAREVRARKAPVQESSMPETSAEPVSAEKPEPPQGVSPI